MENPVYQIGMGVSAAQLHRNGFRVIGQRDFAASEVLYSKVDKEHAIDPNLNDHDGSEWYMDYFSVD